MEVESSPKLSKPLFEGEGGSYHHWTSSDIPTFKEARVGAGKLILKPLGFALPHYSDTAKIGYVVEGKGMAGLISPKDPEEKIVTLQKGDFIKVPLGVVSWWYNDSESDLTIVFLGDTSAAHIPGEITYFFLAGSSGIFTGFSSEFVAKSFGIPEEKADKLFRSQPGVLIVLLEEKIAGLEADENKVHDEIEDYGFSAEAVKLNSDEVWLPRYSSELAVQVITVIKGNAKFQIVDGNGKRVFDDEVSEGKLFVVPKFFVASAIAGDEGVEWFSITTSSKPIYGYFTGKKSILKALSPQILGVSLNVDQALVNVFNPKT